MEHYIGARVEAESGMREPPYCIWVSLTIYFFWSFVGHGRSQWGWGGHWLLGPSCGCSLIHQRGNDSRKKLVGKFAQSHVTWSGKMTEMVQYICPIYAIVSMQYK
jgi:hypothetical protein